jgi:hypothetical protein
MTVLPRMTISPIVSPSAGTSAICSSTTRTPPAVIMPTPCRACSAARWPAVSSAQCGWNWQKVSGP